VLIIIDTLKYICEIHKMKKAPFMELLCGEAGIRTRGTALHSTTV